MNIGKTIDDINIPIEGLCYADIMEIKNIFSNRRHDLWLESIITSEDVDFETLAATQEAVYSSMNEMTPIGRCNRILRAVETIEKKFKLIFDNKDGRRNINE